MHPSNIMESGRDDNPKKISVVSFIPVAIIILLSILFLSTYITNGDLTKPTRHSYSCRDCNLILISVDTLRTDLGVYGYFRNTSPAIDEFARESIVFEKCIVQAPWTLTSHMSMLTSLYSSNHGVVNQTTKLKNSTTTLADVLYNRGYKTAAFTAGGYTSRQYNYHTFEVFDDSGNHSGRNFNKMLEWLDENSDSKFFLFWHDFQPHSPYNTSSEYDIFSDKNYAGIVNPNPDENEPLCVGIEHSRRLKYCTGKFWVYYSLILDNMADSDVAYVKSKYDGEVLTADQRFSRLIAALKNKGVLNKTIIVFTSDHGESFAERERLKKIDHHLMYEEVLRVPLIIRVPGVGRQVRVENVVESIDIMPTVLSILDVSIPGGLDGESLLSTIKNPGKEGIAYSEHFYFHPQGEYAIRYQDYKMIYYAEEGVFEFYNLTADPYERNNIFGLNTSIEGEIQNILLSKIPDHIITTEEVTLDEEIIERLSYLGYLS